MKRDRPMRRAVIVVIFVVVIASMLTVWAFTSHTNELAPSRPLQASNVEVIELPEPVTHGNVSVEDALQNRRSVRDYTSADVSLDEISQLVWAAQGVTNTQGFRTTPSAGALYPLDVYVANTTGVYHYNPKNHSLETITSTNVREGLTKAALDQNAIRKAPLTLVITGAYERTAVKYGDRAERYVLLEAGHAAQNVLLECTALGLGAVPVGAFEDAGVQAAVGIPEDQKPVYLISVGRIS